LKRAIIFTLKDLRNAIAHNEPIYDNRFRSGSISDDLKNCIKADTGIALNFNKIFDYFILVAYILNNLKVSKLDIYKLLQSFELNGDIMHKKLDDASIFFTIIETDTNKKIKQMIEYIKKN